MALSRLDQARFLIREELRGIDGFIDATNLATIVHKKCPAVDFQCLVNAVIEEAIAVGGSVAWADPGSRNRSSRMVRNAAS